MSISKCLVLTGFLVSILSCQSESQTPLKWTSTTEITIYHGGGMAPESETVNIKGLKGQYINWVMPKRDTFRFKLTQQEADAILKRVNSSHFLSLKSVESGSIAYDAPTTSIELKYGNKIHKVSEGATVEIKGGKTEEFSYLYDYVLNLALKKTNQKPQAP